MANLVTVIETCDREIPRLTDALDGLIHNNPDKPESNLATIRRALDALATMQNELVALTIAVSQYEARKAAHEAQKEGR